MKRPLKDVRPIGPFSVKKTNIGLTREDDDKEFLLTFDLQGDVSEFNDNKAAFSNFVKSALRSDTVMFRSYKGFRANESPFDGDSYKAIGIMNDKSKLRVNKVISEINGKVEDSSVPSEFKVEGIAIEMRE